VAADEFPGGKALRIFVIIFGFLGIMPAFANDHPAFLPSRDVVVGYDVSAPGRPAAEYQLQYLAAGERARIDDPAHGTYLLVDLPAGRAELVVPGLHSVVDAPDLSGLTAQIDDAGNARFTPLGPGNYAGLGCEKYLVLAAQGSGTVCLTPDGVILHFAGRDAHGSAEVTANSVSFQPVSEEDLAPPDGFSRITLPPGALQQLLGQ
jgi:hypothetical protein